MDSEDYLLRVVGRSVDADLNPGEKAILNRVTEVEELRDRVERLIGRQDGPHILVVGGQGLSVLRVWVIGLDLGAEVFGPEELSDVGNWGVPDGDGAVGLDCSIGVSQQVGVNGATVIVTRENGLEGSHTVVVGQLDTTEESGVETTLTRLDTRVNTSSIAVPDVDCDGRDRLASVDIDVLNLKEQVYTIAMLLLNNIGAEVLADDIVGTVGDLRGQDTAGLGAEDIL